MSAHILLVDDDPDLLKLVGMRLTASGYQVEAVASAEAGLNVLGARRVDVLVTDWHLPGMDGLALFEEVRRRFPLLPVIILTAFGTVPDAVEAVGRGVFGYLVKPVDGRDLLAKIEQALAASGGMSAETQQEDWQQGVISRSPQMAELLAQTRMVAMTDASVLIRGESGSGKEVLARALHRCSARSQAPFVAVNCGAIPDNLLESELFGHEKGAFTGASSRHQGLVLEADGGTLFLDEIGDMPLALQVKLLRLLQDREVRPVGAARSRPVDIRVVSATHRDLEALMRDGQFREDLFYRLNVVTLTLPSLSERREDIPLLAQHFLAQVAKRYGRPLPAFAPEALEFLAASRWPGNIRQLANVVEQCCVLCSGPVVTLTQVQKSVSEEAVAIPSLAEHRRQTERDYLERLLRLTGGNVADAARLAERNRTEFYRLLQRHELDAASFKERN
ncbi:MAG: sigma 54-interacting transcriptional regulator [Paludibacterium sp.]|uniref:sigma 54-interacting transcriptional regulator n=1 Tax=Paludibacterium sp. TaxID=1917523 RepID=UPI0025D60A6D|nr:sigma 54-interacting transcriptional regulator [Paludibacterium sp.]MBV8048468.1 sigma 54-interacting transcriptional regulator [Paludibacterium sp.]MBV8646265.1 sigma 54-interacting transcriptional regulator [Paludibacterium sp.]